jgi:hypothetical protein
MVWDQGVAGSNPVFPTKLKLASTASFAVLDVLVKKVEKYELGNFY